MTRHDALMFRNTFLGVCGYLITGVLFVRFLKAYPLMPWPTSTSMADEGFAVILWPLFAIFYTAAHVLRFLGWLTT